MLNILMDPKWQFQEEYILKDPKWQFHEEYILKDTKWQFHWEEYRLPECEAVSRGRNIPMFQAKLVIPT